VVDLGQGVRLRVVHTPGHTPGSVCFYWESGGILFTGDAIQGHGWRHGVTPLYFDAEYVSSLDRIESLGGRTAVPVTEIPQMVTYALFEDPDGLLVGLMKLEQPQEGQAQGPSAGEGAAVDWFEVLGSDAQRTQRFYADAFGWEVQTGDFPGYGLVDTLSDRGIRGGLGGGDSRWATVYASVPDVERTLARAEELGAQRVYGPMAVGEQMRTGALRDPAGNVFGIYEAVRA
jgi:predicted enzyme related to lactoylglutathione lyase